MPVTAKLSKAFYERLGDDIANQLVEWFNDVDATYREDLRQLNELNFQRFDANMKRRISESEHKLGQRMSALERRMDALAATLDRRMSSVETTLERRLGEQTRWLFLTWATLLIPIIGLWFRP
jgi:biopolymer transport protein ExbB/TolQ